MGRLANAPFVDVDTAAAIGLGNVDNTSDAAKPVSTAQNTAIGLKANASAVSNVTNTSDANKPVSTAQQTALDSKLNATAKAADAELLDGLNGLAYARRDNMFHSKYYRQYDYDDGYGSANYVQAFLRDGVVNWQGFGDAANPEFQVDGDKMYHAGNIGERVYESGELTLGNGTLVTITHGLGAKPSRIWTFIRCKTADDGYAVGDELQVSGPYVGSAGTGRTFNVYTDNTTQVKCRFGNVSAAFSAGNQDTGNNVTLLNANWKLVIGAAL